MRSTLLPPLFLLALALPAHAEAPPPTPIPSLDVPRYMGTWYEIARYPNRFQQQCVARVSAQYVLEDGGTLRVANRCQLANGDMEEAIGQARQIGPADSPRLEVRFAPAWLSWLPAVWGDYWVFDLDPNYQLAAVGSPSREYLWILSRTPTVPAAAEAALRERLSAQGFEPQRLVHTVQP